MTTEIVEVVTAEGQAAFYTDDQAAIRAGARRDGSSYNGQPVTPGYQAIRQPAEALSVLLVLSDGQVAHGDCVGVQYSGIAGRKPPFAAEEARKVVANVVAPAIIGQHAESFRTAVSSLADIPACPAVAYGVSQALLDAAALATRRTAAEVIVDEYDTGVVLRPIPLMAQSGEDRYDAVDAMVLKGVNALPHGLINNAAALVGNDGQLLLDYIRWVNERVRALRADTDYCPVLHIDMCGTPGSVFGTIGSLASGYGRSNGSAAIAPNYAESLDAWRLGSAAITSRRLPPLILDVCRPNALSTALS